MAFWGRKNEGDTVVGLIASAIRRDISFGGLAPDAKLKIEDLRGRYGGSNHSMREALTRLAAEGLVEANAQRGFRVASATEADLKDITRLRAHLELMGLEWSMKNGDVAWEARVVAAHHALTRAQELVEADPLDHALAWDDANRAFHGVLLSASGSPRLIAMHAQLYDQSRRFRLAALREGTLDFKGIRDTHQALVDAVLSGDSAGALTCLARDIEGSAGQNNTPDQAG